jgi:hypothetical protein
VSLPNPPLFDAAQAGLAEGYTTTTTQLPVVQLEETHVAPRLRPMTLPDGSWLLVLDGASHLDSAELDEAERVLLAHTAAAGLLVLSARVDVESCCVPVKTPPPALASVPA